MNTPKNIGSNANHHAAKKAQVTAIVLRAFYINLIIISLILVIKAYAYHSSHSSAMLASLVDSSSDAILSVIMFFFLLWSLKPADEKHRFGHGKIEGFSALLQSSFLFAAAFFLILEIGKQSLKPAPIEQHSLAILVSLLSMVLTAILVWAQRVAHQKTSSLSLKANEAHYTSDIVLNLGVIIALGADLIGLGSVFDIAVSGLIALYLAWTGYDIGSDAVDMLMDKEISDKERSIISNIILSHPEIHHFHDLRTRHSGLELHISFDIELNPKMTLEDAHSIAEKVDQELLQAFPNAEIIIHKDPIGHVHDSRHKIQGIHDQ